jgi:menaquinol-cytochrome c reductase iron-sulfur subunit
MAEPVRKKVADRAETPAAPPPVPSGARAERRTALRMLVTASGLAYAGAIAVPAVSFLASTGPAEAGGARWIRIGRLAELPLDVPRRMQVVGDERDAFTVTRDELLGSVWVRREGDGVRALSATCPHLGCAVDLDADQKSFGCPCHTSRFALAGEALAGPSPRGMDPLATRVVDGFVEVDFRHFRQGVTDREEVSS